MNTLRFKKELENALKEIEGISFSINHEKTMEGVVYEIEFNYNKFNGVEDDWSNKVDDVLKGLYSEWGGSFYWEDNVIYYSLAE